MFNPPSKPRSNGGDAFGQRRSVTLDAPTRNTRNDRVPYCIGFIAHPYQIGTPGPNGFITMSGAVAEGPDGILVAAGAFTDINLAVPRDTPYLLQWIKFDAWNPTTAAAGTGTRSQLIAPSTLYDVAGSTSTFTAQGNQNLMYNTFLAASVWLGSAGSRDQYGGLAVHPQSRQPVDVPLQVQSLQGSQDGPCCLKVEALLGQNTTLIVRIYNNFTTALRVNGMAFGYKLPAKVTV